MVAAWAPDPAFEAGSVPVTELRLCHVRLQDDDRFPWLVLLPRLAGATELLDLAPDHRALLMEEIAAASHAVRALGAAQGRPPDKLNVAALGNVTAQLHVHVVGRRRDDGLWPDPVWGRGGGAPLEIGLRDRLVALVRREFASAGPQDGRSTTR